jgi:hypothetical protein
MSVEILKVEQYFEQLSTIKFENLGKKWTIS